MNNPPTQKPAGVGRASQRDMQTDDDSSRIGGHQAAVNQMVERRREALLADLRRASLSARLWQADIDAIGLSLRDGFITTQQALDAMHEMGIPITFDVLPGPGDTIGQAA